MVQAFLKDMGSVGVGVKVGRGFEGSILYGQSGERSCDPSGV